MRSNFVGGLGQTSRHVGKPGDGLTNKIIAEYLLQVALRGQIIVVDLEGLLEWARFEFDEIAVIPVEDRDLALRMGYFSNNAHNCLVFWLFYEVKTFKPPPSNFSLKQRFRCIFKALWITSLDYDELC